jgi:hypothetical protein
VLTFTERGDSGSWVVQGDALLGFVFAGQELLPFAYMIPVSSLLDDLRATYQTGDISITPPGGFEEQSRLTDYVVNWGETVSGDDTHGMSTLPYETTASDTGFGESFFQLSERVNAYQPKTNSQSIERNSPALSFATSKAKSKNPKSQYWYCCKCGNGPMTVVNHPACVGGRCSNHVTCRRCRIEFR